jgi:hypothetical protein
MEHPVLIYIPAVDELEIKVQEVTRYLGYGGNPAEGEDLKLIERKIAEVKKIMAPKACYARYRIDNDEEKCVLTFPYGETKSKVLSKHLSGCDEVFIFAATIGAVFDRMLQRARFLSMSETAVMQAVGAAAVETVCDSVNEMLEQKVTEESKYLRARFSPGYGDFELANQRGIFSVLNPAKHAGITLMDTMIMAPEKSVTAVIGISDRPGKNGYG